MKDRKAVNSPALHTQTENYIWTRFDRKVPKKVKLLSDMIRNYDGEIIPRGTILECMVHPDGRIFVIHNLVHIQYANKVWVEEWHEQDPEVTIKIIPPLKKKEKKNKPSPRDTWTPEAKRKVDEYFREKRRRPVFRENNSNRSSSPVGTLKPKVENVTTLKLAMMDVFVRCPNCGKKNLVPSNAQP